MSERSYALPPEEKRRLRPCPFCQSADGSTPQMYVTYAPNCDDQPIVMGATRVIVSAQIWCPNCKARGALKERSKTPGGFNYDGALTDDWVVRGCVDRWNNRYI